MRLKHETAIKGEEEEEEEEEEERPVRVDNSRVNSRWKKIIVDNSRAMRAPFTFPLASLEAWVLSFGTPIRARPVNGNAH